MSVKSEVVIIGAGVIGSSVAMHLAKKGVTQIRVIDFDLEGSLSSSELNAGGVRATWNQPINIDMSKISIEYFDQVKEQVGYKACGYLWLYSPEKITEAKQAHERQVQRGWPVELWDIPRLQKSHPFIDKVDGLAGAAFAPRDGLINPNLLKNHFRSEARALGVIFDDRTRIREARYPEKSEYRCHLIAERFESVMSHESKLEIASHPEKDFERTRVEYHTQIVINCAGPWAGNLARILGYPCPTYAMRRQVSIFDCRDLDLTPYGMLIDTSGVYFHPEATNGLAGFATPNEPQGINYNYDGENFFNEMIWPALYERSSYFERLKHLTGWAGLYDVSPDECALIGQVNYGGVSSKKGIYEAHSFSGHGVMHSFAAGLLLAEKIVSGKFETLDADILWGGRFEKGQYVRENCVI